MADILAASWHYLATDWPVSGIPSHVPAYLKRQNRCSRQAAAMPPHSIITVRILLL